MIKEWIQLVWLMVLVVFYDKMNRLVTLTKEDAAVKDESIDDTLRDLACYSIMLLTYRKRERAAKLKEVELN